MNGKTTHGSESVSAERQKILDDMHKQMRKSQAKIGKRLLMKVREFIFSNPTLRKSFGLKKDQANLEAQDKTQAESSSEPIDRSKNMDIVAKFLENNPDRKSDVSKMLKRD